MKDYKYNPIGSIFRENEAILIVEEQELGATCTRCYYRSRSYRGAGCNIHGHVCTPLFRKDKKHVIFREYDLSKLPI